MEPKLCRQVNNMSMELVAKYYDEPIDKIMGFYSELLEDVDFLNKINERIVYAKKYFDRGIFKHGEVDSIDWFGVQRILIYVITRLTKPELIVETGVFYGGNTTFFLNALRKNQKGKLISIDLPGNIIEDEKRHFLVGNSEKVPTTLETGFLVHENLKDRWDFIRGDSHIELPKINEPIDLFMHDSDHSYNFIKKEFELIWNNLSNSATLLADDLDWSNGFYSIIDQQKLFPMIITDNGKSGLLARTAVVRLDHPFRNKEDIVG